MPETEPETFIDQIFRLLQQLLLPDWNDLIRLLPWTLVALVVLWLLNVVRNWRRAAAHNRTRVPPRLRGSPPPGVHMPGPSRWPFVVPIGAALLLFAFALPPRDAAGNPTAPFNGLLLVLGLFVTFVAVAGWLYDAMKEWRATDRGEHAPALAVAGAEAAALRSGTFSATVMAQPTIPIERALVRAEPPPGVHMPGPSPWPFFAPIALTLMLLGVIFSSVLIIGGLILGIIAAAGWLRDAGREYHSTEAVGHAVPATRDPEKVWPRQIVPVFAGVIAISFLIALAPIGLSYLNGLTPPSAGSTAAAVPAVPEISASTAVSFDTGTLIVPCCRPFELVFKNDHAGVPHNVEIAEGPALANVIIDGEEITGPAEITYQVPAIPEGDYYFLCRIHPNMNGTLLSRPEAGGPAPEPGASPAPQATNPAE